MPKSQFCEAYLSYGGKDIAGEITPIDAAMSNLHNANRAELCNPSGITVEYSTDGCATWTDYGATDANKIGLLSTIGSSVYLGKSVSKNTSATIGLRITLDASKMGLYTRLRKILINYSTNGAAGTKVKFEYSNKGTEDTWKGYKTADISGWSGWSSYFFMCNFGGNSDQTSNWARIRMTFFMSGINSNYGSNPVVNNILLLGTTYWSYPSSIAKNGHLYSYDTNGNATFPAGLTAKTLNGHTIGSDVPANAKFTDTTYNEATTTAAGLMSSSDKSKLNGIDAGANKTVIDTTLSSSSTNPVQNKVINAALNGKANSSHTHNYAGASSAGGAATSADKLNTNAGSATQPVFFQNGVPVATTYTLGKSVPADAKFTDTNTTYENMTAATSSTAGKSGLVPAPAAGKQGSFLRGDGTWATPTNTTYSSATTSSPGLMSAGDKSKLDGIATGATKVVVDSALSSTSTNPVQNKVINSALSSKAIRKTYTATLGTSWSGSGPYTQARICQSLERAFFRWLKIIGYTT